jgi:hypothetical protein
LTRVAVYVTSAVLINKLKGVAMKGSIFANKKNSKGTDKPLPQDLQNHLNSYVAQYNITDKTEIKLVENALSALDKLAKFIDDKESVKEIEALLINVSGNKYFQIFKNQGVPLNGFTTTVLFYLIAKDSPKRFYYTAQIANLLMEHGFDPRILAGDSQNAKNASDYARSVKYVNQSLVNKLDSRIAMSQVVDLQSSAVSSAVSNLSKLVDYIEKGKSVEEVKTLLEGMAGNAELKRLLNTGTLINGTQTTVLFYLLSLDNKSRQKYTAQVAKLLMEHGADPKIQAANGQNFSDATYSVNFANADLRYEADKAIVVGYVPGAGYDQAVATSLLRIVADRIRTKEDLAEIKIWLPKSVDLKRFFNTEVSINGVNTTVLAYLVSLDSKERSEYTAKSAEWLIDNGANPLATYAVVENGVYKGEANLSAFAEAAQRTNPKLVELLNDEAEAAKKLEADLARVQAQFPNSKVWDVVTAVNKLAVFCKENDVDALLQVGFKNNNTPFHQMQKEFLAACSDAQGRLTAEALFTIRMFLYDGKVLNKQFEAGLRSFALGGVPLLSFYTTLNKLLASPKHLDKGVWEVKSEQLRTKEGVYSATEKLSFLYKQNLPATDAELLELRLSNPVCFSVLGSYFVKSSFDKQNAPHIIAVMKSLFEQKIDSVEAVNALSDEMERLCNYVINKIAEKRLVNPNLTFKDVFGDVSVKQSLDQLEIKVERIVRRDFTVFSEDKKKKEQTEKHLSEASEHRAKIKSAAIKSQFPAIANARVEEVFVALEMLKDFVSANNYSIDTLSNAISTIEGQRLQTNFVVACFNVPKDIHIFGHSETNDKFDYRLKQDALDIIKQCLSVNEEYALALKMFNKSGLTLPPSVYATLEYMLDPKSLSSDRQDVGRSFSAIKFFLEKCNVSYTDSDLKSFCEKFPLSLGLFYYRFDKDNINDKNKFSYTLFDRMHSEKGDVKFVITDLPTLPKDVTLDEIYALSDQAKLVGIDFIDVIKAKQAINPSATFKDIFEDQQAIQRFNKREEAIDAPYRRGLKVLCTVENKKVAQTPGIIKILDEAAVRRKAALNISSVSSSQVNATGVISPNISATASVQPQATNVSSSSSGKTLPPVTTRSSSLPPKINMVNSASSDGGSKPSSTASSNNASSESSEDKVGDSKKPADASNGGKVQAVPVGKPADGKVVSLASRPKPPAPVITKAVDDKKNDETVVATSGVDASGHVRGWSYDEDEEKLVEKSDSWIESDLEDSKGKKKELSLAANDDSSSDVVTEDVNAAINLSRKESASKLPSLVLQDSPLTAKNVPGKVKEAVVDGGSKVASLTAGAVSAVLGGGKRVARRSVGAVSSVVGKVTKKEHSSDKSKEQSSVVSGVEDISREHGAIIKLLDKAYYTSLSLVYSEIRNGKGVQLNYLRNSKDNEPFWSDIEKSLQQIDAIYKANPKSTVIIDKLEKLAEDLYDGKVIGAAPSLLIGLAPKKVIEGTPNKPIVRTSVTAIPFSKDWTDARGDDAVSIDVLQNIWAIHSDIIKVLNAQPYNDDVKRKNFDALVKCYEKNFGEEESASETDRKLEAADLFDGIQVAPILSPLAKQKSSKLKVDTNNDQEEIVYHLNRLSDVISKNPTYRMSINSTLQDFIKDASNIFDKELKDLMAALGGGSKVLDEKIAGDIQATHDVIVEKIKSQSQDNAEKENLSSLREIYAVVCNIAVNPKYTFEVLYDRISSFSAGSPLHGDSTIKLKGDKALFGFMQDLKPIYDIVKANPDSKNLIKKELERLVVESKDLKVIPFDINSYVDDGDETAPLKKDEAVSSVSVPLVGDSSRLAPKIKASVSAEKKGAFKLWDFETSVKTIKMLISSPTESEERRKANGLVFLDICKAILANPNPITEADLVKFDLRFGDKDKTVEKLEMFYAEAKKMSELAKNNPDNQAIQDRLKELAEDDKFLSDKLDGFVKVIRKILDNLNERESRQNNYDMLRIILNSIASRPSSGGVILTVRSHIDSLKFSDEAQDGLSAKREACRDSFNKITEFIKAHSTSESLITKLKELAKEQFKVSVQSLSSESSSSSSRRSGGFADMVRKPEDNSPVQQVNECLNKISDLFNSTKDAKYKEKNERAFKKLLKEFADNGVETYKNKSFSVMSYMDNFKFKDSKKDKRATLSAEIDKIISIVDFAVSKAAVKELFDAWPKRVADKSVSSSSASDQPRSAAVSFSGSTKGNPKSAGLSIKDKLESVTNQVSSVGGDIKGKFTELVGGKSTSSAKPSAPSSPRKLSPRVLQVINPSPRSRSGSMGDAILAETAKAVSQKWLDQINTCVGDIIDLLYDSDEKKSLHSNKKFCQLLLTSILTSCKDGTNKSSVEEMEQSFAGVKLSFASDSEGKQKICLEAFGKLYDVAFDHFKDDAVKARIKELATKGLCVPEKEQEKSRQ